MNQLITGLDLTEKNNDEDLNWLRAMYIEYTFIRRNIFTLLSCHVFIVWQIFTPACWRYIGDVMIDTLTDWNCLWFYISTNSVYCIVSIVEGSTTLFNYIHPVGDHHICNSSDLGNLVISPIPIIIWIIK